jgi:phosphonate transport system substrate-binding protein
LGKNTMLNFRGFPLIAAIFGVFLSHSLHADTYSFGVLPQRSPVLTAQYWNPIFDYVQRKTGINLTLKLARNAQESDEISGKGEYDFVYSNHIFQPNIAPAGYQVILRPSDEAITSQIVTLSNSPVKNLKELTGKEVGFPSQTAFVGYEVPMDQLQRQNIGITAVFGGNQEGIMAQLKVGRVIAAGVNNQVMKAYATRENIGYRVLWESIPYRNIPIAVHPRIPKAVAEAVKAAIDSMDQNPEGQQILETSGQAIGQKPPYGFRAATPSDYKSYVEFYKNAAGK